MFVRINKEQANYLRVLLANDHSDKAMPIIRAIAEAEDRETSTEIDVTKVNNAQLCTCVSCNKRMAPEEYLRHSCR